MSQSNNPALQTFFFQDHELTVFIAENGEPWFIAKEVADILGYSDAEAMTRKLDDDEKSNLQIVGLGTPTGGRGTSIINESGLYASVLTSKKPSAKVFRKYVTSEVLPAIRKTGSYTAPQAAVANTQPLELILTELISLMRDVAASQKQNIALIERLTEKPQPKTRAAHKDDLASILQLNAEGVSQAEIGRTLGIGNPTVSLILRGAYRINPDGRITVGLLYKTESEGEPA